MRARARGARRLLTPELDRPLAPVSSSRRCKYRPKASRSTGIKPLRGSSTPGLSPPMPNRTAVDSFLGTAKHGKGQATKGKKPGEYSGHKLFSLVFLLGLC